jgi:hypothetical protein
VGLVALYYGPLEIVCFSFFSPGGRFHYEGFGFGSFMFGNLATQILGYYLIALVCIPLGYGHLRLRWWVRPITLALLQSFRVVGLPLILVFLFILLSSKSLSLAAAMAAAAILVLGYFFGVEVLLRFYRGEWVERCLKEGETAAGDSRLPPVPILVLVFLDIVYLAALHVLLFFGALFPLPQGWVVGPPAFRVIAACVVWLCVLGWGLMERIRAAWWAALATFTGVAALWIVALSRTRWADLIELLGFPAFELKMLGDLPLEGWHFAALLALPFSLTLMALMQARRCFGRASYGATVGPQ